MDPMNVARLEEIGDMGNEKIDVLLIIEVRPYIEKGRLKGKIRKLKSQLRLGKTHKVPHLTLVYDFRPNNMAPYKIAEIIKSTAKKYGRLYYRYNGYEVKQGERGYVFGFRIEPSPELRKFRYDLYKSLKPHISDDQRTAKFNERSEEDYWFHSAIAFHMNDRAAQRAEDFVNGSIHESFLGKLAGIVFGSNIKNKNQLSNSSIMDSEVIRIPIIMKNKIAYEYDTLLGKILNRQEALSGYYRRQTLSKYREIENIEVKRRSYRPKSTTWLISDTHFYHVPIVRFSARPFYDIKEMNEILASNWNNTVAPTDTVYFLGDLALGRERDPPKRAKPELTHMWEQKLNGKKIFINGNHDPEDFGEKSKTIEYQGIKFMLVHDPKDAHEFDGWIIHGHTHNNDLVNTPFINFEKRTINVSAELIGYKPIDFDKVVKLIKSPMKKNILYYK